ncbi:MAG: EamA family transporter [Hyphomicrobiales bacterium]|nr:EamA family transporter [Hyphomicrobiales bacterium]MCP5000082.1 EamA family transporter [Hyphomicrobiales bacterium]
MSAGIVTLVLFAAFLHAFWNAIVKGAGDKTIVLGLIALGHVVPGFVIISMTQAPGWHSAPYILASTVVHWGYYYLLNMAYRLGDLSIIYPIARGLAPVLVALGALLWVGENLSWMAWGGIVCVSLGIMTLAGGVFSGTLPLAGVLAAIGVAVIVAAYSLIDGVGVRRSNDAMGYIGWLFVAELAVAGYIFATRPQRLLQASAKTLCLGFFGGLVSGAAYALVLYAKTLAPLGIVSALRETSVIFAAMIGVTWFGEGPKRNRLIAAVIVAAGIVLVGVVR